MGDVPEDVRDRDAKIDDIASTYGPQFFEDPEMLTAARRTLRLVATQNPGVFRRRSEDLNTAATIPFIAGHNNRWTTRYHLNRTQAALAKVIGLTSRSGPHIHPAGGGSQPTGQRGESLPSPSADPNYSRQMDERPCGKKRRGLKEWSRWKGCVSTWTRPRIGRDNRCYPLYDPVAVNRLL